MKLCEIFIPDLLTDAFLLDCRIIFLSPKISVYKLIFNEAFYLVITNLFIHVVPRLHKVIVNIKIAHYFLIQITENCKEAFCNLVFHIIVSLILF